MCALQSVTVLSPTAYGGLVNNSESYQVHTHTSKNSQRVSVCVKGGEYLIYCTFTSHCVCIPCTKDGDKTLWTLWTFTFLKGKSVFILFLLIVIQQHEKSEKIKPSIFFVEIQLIFLQFFKEIFVFFILVY